MSGRSRAMRVRAGAAAWLLPAFLIAAAHAGAPPVATSTDSDHTVQSALPAQGPAAAGAEHREGIGAGAGGAITVLPHGEAALPLRDTPSQVEAAAAAVRAMAVLDHHHADRRARTGLPVTHGTPPPRSRV